MITKIEKIQSLLEQVEADIRKDTAHDITIDLADFAKDAAAADRAGLRLAIQIIKSNYM